MDQTYTFQNKELLTITKNADTVLYSTVSLNSVQNIKTNRQAVPVLTLRKHENQWFWLISLLVQHQNSSGILLLTQLEARAIFTSVAFFLLNMCDHFY